MPLMEMRKILKEGDSDRIGPVFANVSPLTTLLDRIETSEDEVRELGGLICGHGTVPVGKHLIGKATAAIRRVNLRGY